MTSSCLRAAACALALAGCGPLHWEKEAWSEYYGKPAAETERTLLERRQIIHWSSDPGRKERVGFLETYSILLEGSRVPREYHLILNGSGTERLGHINETGIFYRFTPNGEMVPVGEYPIIDTGLKIFFGFPLSDHLAFEPLDPYRN
ncbi:MAG: hypothetical protein HY716_06890 [Planctomycetes bacterium]|nr:hypothetical protein [Planctomycetota bacterium]